MKTLSKIKLASVTGIICISIFCLPTAGIAQHFGHGGGGGGFHGGGGGGGFHGGGGGGFNGGGRNIGAHVYAPAGRPSGARIDGGGVRGYGGVRSEGVYHGGYGFHPYFYHPFHPYVWGPYWHPFGYFAGTLTADAIMFSIANQQYYYDNGVYYEPYSGGYTVVAPPIGAVVGYLPAGYLTVPMDDGSTYYYYGGTFYISQGGSFRVVPAPVGAIVTGIPDGATDQNVNGQDYLLYNNTYYQPISQNGQDAYQVVQVN